MNIWKSGLAGEMRAARYVRRHGMRILKRRYRTAHGEIDLIAKEKQTVVFLEVKYRPQGKPGEGLWAIDEKKRRHVRYAAAHYLQSHPAQEVRFDIIEISAEGLTHLKNAF